MAADIRQILYQNVRALLWIGLLIVSSNLGACRQGPVSFDRHNLSRLWTPDGADVIYFDASTTPQYPAGSAAADVTRQAWIDEWMSLRKLCNNGYDIIERRAFTREDDNPYAHDLRYTLRCH